MTLGDDVVIKASWHVECNWDHMEAIAFNPEAPWRKEMCYKFFTDAILVELVPAVALCDDASETEVAAATGLLAIADDASVASKPGSSAASASDSRETTQSSPVPWALLSSVKAAEQTEGAIVPLVSIPWSEEKPHPAQASGLGGGQEYAHGWLATSLMGLECVGRGEAAHCIKTHKKCKQVFCWIGT